VVRNSDLAAHPVVRGRYPFLAQAILPGVTANPQHGNRRRNLLQRTRCLP
jgi:xanthine dehydrogenase YagS FAD-binding subunit